jgi:pimeloyl-ACP methyl ester carboxylesterase
LIEHLSDEPATVFGSSSGGVIILAVLTYHPSVVRTLVPYESAAVRQLPDGQQWVDFFFGIYDLYRQSGMEPALKKFCEQTFAESDRQVMARAIDLKNGEIRANTTYWFERELRQYPAVTPVMRPNPPSSHASLCRLLCGQSTVRRREVVHYTLPATV